MVDLFVPKNNHLNLFQQISILKKSLFFLEDVLLSNKKKKKKKKKPTNKTEGLTCLMEVIKVGRNCNCQDDEIKDTDCVTFSRTSLHYFTLQCTQWLTIQKNSNTVDAG